MVEGGELLEEVACPLCGAERRVVLREARYPEGLTAEALAEAYRSSSDQELLDRLVRCEQCSLAYLSPRVRGDLILSGYTDAVDPTFFEQNPLRIRTFRRALGALARRYGLEPSATRVLDVGCAGGAFPAAAHELGFPVTGVEPARWLSEKARESYGLDIRQGTLEEQDFEAGSYDLATLWDVVEHLTDPGSVVDELHRILAPDGLLVVNYPDLGGIVARLLGDRWPFLLSVHLTYFSPPTIRRFLEEHGFEVLSIRPFWQTLEWGYVLERAQPYAPGMGLLRRLVMALGLGRLPFTYHLSQFLLVARRRA